MPTKTEIESLLFLLEDPDPFVQDNVRSRLFELGERAVPLLDQHKNQSVDEAEREMINEIIHNITVDSFEEDFLDVLENGLSNYKQLEDAVLTLSRFDNPTIRIEEIRKKLDRYAMMIRDDIRYKMNDGDKMRRLLRFVFEDLNFKGNTKDYHNPANSYIHSVINRRLGLPISLALVVMFIARRLELPFYGVNMPIHFMLKYESDQQKVMIDPFDGGNIVTYDQCYYFLKKNGVTPKAEHFERAREVDILTRSIRNLMHSYSKHDEEKRVEHLQNLLGTVEMMFDG